MVFLVGSAQFSVIQRFFAVNSAPLQCFLSSFRELTLALAVNFRSEFSALSSLRSDILLIYKDEIRPNTVKLCIWKSYRLGTFLRRNSGKIDWGLNCEFVENPQHWGVPETDWHWMTPIDTGKFKIAYFFIGDNWIFNGDISFNGDIWGLFWP